MVICLEQGADGLHMVQLMPLPPHHLMLQLNPKWFILLVYQLSQFVLEKCRQMTVVLVGVTINYLKSPIIV